MQKITPLILLILKAVALGMSVTSLSMGILKTATLETHVTLLAIGMFALALAALLQGQEPG
jgi:hypothetical protein